jgi:hypothetical protein
VKADDTPAAALETHYRYADLRARNIVPTWPALYAWIKAGRFPPGKHVSPRIRIWSHSEIQAWLDNQSSEAA